MDIGIIALPIGVGITPFSLLFITSPTLSKFGLVILSIGLITLTLSITSMSLGALSLNDLSKNDLHLVASGQYRIEPDCFNQKSYYIGNVDLKTFNKNMFTSTEPHTRLGDSSLKENSNYSLYRKDYFLGYNNIVFCDN